MSRYGLGFITGSTWNANTKVYGILPEIWGTMYSSLLALIFGTIFGLAVAICLSEHYLGTFVFGVLKIFGVQFHPFWGKLPEKIEHLLKNLIELLAAIPSVVYGLWGIFCVIPLIRPACNLIHAKLGWIPIFGTTLSGPGMLPASIVLSIMVIPTITAISLNALLAVPGKLREAAYGLGRHQVGKHPGRTDSRPHRRESSARSFWPSAVRWAKPWLLPCSSGTQTS